MDAFKNKGGSISTMSKANDETPEQHKPKADKVKSKCRRDCGNKDKPRLPISSARSVKPIHARPNNNKNDPGYVELCKDEKEPK